MLSQNVLNIEKKGNISGTTFHLYYPDLHTSIFFDKDFSSPIIYGNKNVVMTQVKSLDKLLNVENTTKVRIYSYIFDLSVGYRRVDTYNGPISTIGKYIRRI